MALNILQAISAKVNEGSGCIFRTGAVYDYILTARHCIADISSPEELAAFDKSSHQITVSVNTGTLETDKINVLTYFISDDINIDIAVILIESNQGIPSIEYQSIIPRSNATIYGYPGVSAENTDPRESIECEINLFSEENPGFDLTAKNSLSTFNRSTKENVEGFSGSGVFKIDNNFVYLVGITTRLKNPDGALNKISAIKISLFNDLLSKQAYEGSSLTPLVPHFLTSFENYMEGLFAFNNPVLKEILLKQAQSVANSGLTPLSIADFLNEKIFIPHSKGLSTNHPELWKGWLEFLTYLSFDTIEEKFCNVPKSILRPEVAKHKKYFYYLADGKIEGEWGPIIRHVLIESGKAFKTGSKFFINNGARSLDPRRLPQDLFKMLVLDISTAEEQRITNKRLQIDKSNNIAENYTFIHLREFSNIFTQHTFSSIRDAEKLRDEIQLALKEMLFHE